MKLLFAAVFPIFFLSAIKQADSSAYDKIVTHSRIRAKKEGPNVCALQQVMGTNKKYFSTCRNWYQGSICGKKATVLYECCPGYMKLDGMPGCPAVAPIDNVYGTLGIVNALLTQDYTDQSKLREEIEGRGSFTFFAPSDEAWSLLDPEVRSALVSNVNIELYNALHYHMVNKRLLTKDLKNGMTLESMYNKLGLLINHYSNGIVTVNCARIIHGNQIATNGVVHKIDRVVTAVSNTIQDYIEIEDDVSSFKAAAIASDMIDKFGEPGHYTLFLPTNEAFAKLPRAVLERIMSDKVALQAVLNFHTLNSVQCSEAIMGGSSYETLEGNNIEIGCDGESLTVNGVKMVKRKDIVTTNGVIHLIDEVLIPDSAKQVLELTGSSQTTFTDLVAQLGLSGSMRPQGEYTLLAPLNAAFSDDVMGMDQRVLKLILQNHILKNKIVLSGLYNGQLLETLGGKTLRVFIYRTSVCIENSCMVRGSKEGRNGALHLLRNIIKPAEKPMIDILRGDDRFSIFLSLVEAAGLTEMLKQEGDWTLFAPTNDAFENLSEEEMELLTSDINTLRAILLYHFSNGIYIGGGMELGVTNLLKSIQGNNLMVKAINNTIMANEIKAEESDVMANNGVIHVVKSLLYPAEMPVGNNQLLTILKKLIKNIQLKFIQGYKYKEIPLTFIKRVQVTGGHTITKVISGEPQKPKARKPKVKVVGGEKVKKVVQDHLVRDQEYRYRAATGKKSYHVFEDPSVTTTIRRVIEEPSMTKLTRVIEGEPSLTKITRVIEGEPSLTKITRVIEGEPSFTKLTRVIEGEPAITKVTRVIQGESDINFGQGETITKVIHAGEIENEEDIKRLLEQEVTKVKKLLESDGHLLEDEEIKRLLQGDNIKRPPPRRPPVPKRRTRKVRQEKN